MPATMPPLRRVLRLAVLVLLLLPHAAAATPEVRVEAGRLSLRAEQEPLREVLAELQLYGIRVRMDASLDQPVTATFRNRDLRKGLAHILKDVNHVLIWKSVEGPVGPISRLAEIHVFRPGHRDRMRELRPAASAFRLVRDPADGSLHVKDELLLRVRKGVGVAAFEALLRELGATVLDSHPGLGVYRIRLPEGTDVPALAAALAKDPRVGEVEPNLAFPIPLPAPVPGSQADGVQTAVPGESGSVPVAVLDTGLLPDAEMGDRVVASLDAIEPGARLSDPVGHGTQMALIAAGVVKPLGVDPEADLTSPVIPIRAFDENGYTSSFTLLESIDFAIENGARVMSLSWGSEKRSAFMADAMDLARARGLIVVASAGNEPTGKPVYPAAYDSVLGVAALAPNGQRWENSNYGSFVSLYAPGFADLPVGYKGGPGTYAGTSIAAAFAANVIASYLDEHPQATMEEMLTDLARNPQP